MPFALTPLGDSAFVLRTGNSLGEVLGAARKLEAGQLDGVEEVIPAFASVGIFLAAPPRNLEEVAKEILAVLGKRARRGKGAAGPRLIEVPVCYESGFAPDLEEVAEHCRLTPNELVKRHAAARYRVRCVGFTPGFPYLSGLPPALAMPRRATPRTSVPAGSVAIGGIHTGIYPLSSPGGWNLIGRTPLSLFDPTRPAPALLRPGDRVRFRPISQDQFDRWDR